MDTAQYLDALKKRLQLDSDYAVGKVLGADTAQMSKYRNRKRGFEPLMASKVAALLGVPEMKVIADMELQRARTPEDRALWKRIAGNAAGMLLAFGAGYIIGQLQGDLTVTELLVAFVPGAVTNLTGIHIAQLLVIAAAVAALAILRHRGLHVHWWKRTGTRRRCRCRAVQYLRYAGTDSRWEPEQG